MIARYTHQPLYEVMADLEARLAGGEPVEFEAPDPDRSAGHFAGESVDGARHRSLAVWVRVAEQLGCALTTPRPLADGFIRLGLRPLDDDASWHRTAGASGAPEKYGAQSVFARIDKFEQPDFLVAFRQAVAFVDPPATARVLAVGCNQGDELAMVLHARPQARLVGLDHSASAIERGRIQLPEADLREVDLNDFDALDLGRFDLVVAINVLHSPGLDGQALCRRLVTRHLTPSGGLVIGLPNSRYIGTALRYGAAVKNRSHAELSVLVRDAASYKRYLARHLFQVTLTGQHTLLVTGRALPERIRRQQARLD